MALADIKYNDLCDTLYREAQIITIESKEWNFGSLKSYFVSINKYDWNYLQSNLRV